MPDLTPWTRLYSPGVPSTLPLPTESVIDLFEATVKKTPDAPAVHYFDRTLTYGELDDLATRFATLLASWSIGRGDRVALYLQTSRSI